MWKSYLLVNISSNNRKPYIYGKLQSFMKLGRQYVTDVINMNAFEEIAKYEGPVLILHGTADTAVDVSNSKKAVEVYKNARLELLEGAGHGFFKENEKRALALLGDFLRALLCGMNMIVLL